MLVRIFLKLIEEESGTKNTYSLRKNKIIQIMLLGERVNEKNQVVYQLMDECIELNFLMNQKKIFFQQERILAILKIYQITTNKQKTKILKQHVNRFIQFI
ncbi:hypothetical protein TTHERM_000860479 (macronuclear) [Tetrahymena thermophila SB210]|uniref:Uncharacterized protein n=1 Tax=Tetrahymena thermophila (strain SB210) TaxID=312017 RepID=W7X496_TETTS|nr:hypothetical protein TTHERM_000860479 [Tetrahymena thermophila SB210]EWS74140.1 hypothetical protein TTHERM_000860479 [Tetrahymena thermophila SB210]|eukprot:XP_012653325.1 hypothetical protein TTHERM_000860479 [Tetrahymena thermophila SB210]